MRNQLLLALAFAGVCLSCNNKDKEADITSALVVHIPLDGNAVEVASNTTGTIFNATPAEDRTGTSGKAMHFNPADSSYIDFGDLAAASFPDNIFTISCWIKTPDTAQVRAVLSKRTSGGPFEYSLDNHFDHSAYTLDNWVSNGAGTVYGVDPLNARAAISLDTWQHVAFVADGATLKVYTDGVLQSGTDLHQDGKSFGNTSAPFTLGMGGAFGVNHYFSGDIDEVRIYHRALSREDIEALAEY